MIKFVHKKHADRARGTARIIITYSFMEILLGLLLLITNISATLMIYNFTKNFQGDVNLFSTAEYVRK